MPLPKGSEKPQDGGDQDSDADIDDLSELKKQLFDLQITNRGKDFLIERMKEERNGFFDQLLQANRKVGELETRLLQLEAPAGRTREAAETN